MVVHQDEGGESAQKRQRWCKGSHGDGDAVKLRTVRLLIEEVIKVDDNAVDMLIINGRITSMDGMNVCVCVYRSVGIVLLLVWK